MNALAKMFGVWASTILTWIRHYAADHAEKPAPSGKAIVLEIDAMWHFLKKKRRKLWIWKALDRDTGRLLDWECGRRDAATLKGQGHGGPHHGAVCPVPGQWRRRRDLHSRYDYLT